MRVLVLVLCGLFLGFLSPTQAQAWGKYGHLTVCDLAYRNLTPASKTAVIDLLRSRNGGVTVRGRHYTSFNVGCLEEDSFPRLNPEDHFVNVDRATMTIASVCPNGGECILHGIQRDLAVLKDASKSRDDRVTALMAIGHWVGDVHQPLHISFADDRGGNFIDARVIGGCGTSSDSADNLHAVWDKCLLQAGMFERVRKRADFKTTWGPNTITYRAVDTLQANTTVTEERGLVGTDPSVWANESYQITLDPKVLYCTRVGADCQYSPAALKFATGVPKRKQTVDAAYKTAFEGVAQERVRLAGFRLAHLMNLALDPAYTVPIQNSTQRP